MCACVKEWIYSKWSNHIFFQFFILCHWILSIFSLLDPVDLTITNEKLYRSKRKRNRKVVFVVVIRILIYSHLPPHRCRCTWEKGGGRKCVYMMDTRLRCSSYYKFTIWQIFLLCIFSLAWMKMSRNHITSELTFSSVVIVLESVFEMTVIHSNWGRKVKESIKTWCTSVPRQRIYIRFQR